MTEALRDLVELAIVVDEFFDQNCYIVRRRDSSSVLVIDPGLQFPRTLELLDAKNLHCDRILLTHGHPDHSSGVPAVKAAHGCTAAIHPDDREQLAAIRKWPGVPSDFPDIVCEDDLRDGEVIRWNDLDLQVTHTPGHTRGSVCFRIGPDIVSGDTLFHRSVGRTDLPGGDHATLINSIRTVLFAFGDDAEVYPGHGPKTTIGEEMRLNPFVPHRRYR